MGVTTDVLNISFCLVLMILSSLNIFVEHLFGIDPNLLLLNRMKFLFFFELSRKTGHWSDFILLYLFFKKPFKPLEKTSKFPERKVTKDFFFYNINVMFKP